MAAGQQSAVTGHRNEVVIAGRLPIAPTARRLPSGDEVVTWRLVVDRPDKGTRRVVDVIDCAAFGARVRRSALRWQPGDVVEVNGSLRRRFWRTPSGPTSRYEVDVTRASKITPAR